MSIDEVALAAAESAAASAVSAAASAEYAAEVIDGGSEVTIDADGSLVVDGVTVELASDAQVAAVSAAIAALGTAALVNTGTSSGDVPLLSTGGRLPIARIASGTPDGTKFVRDDGTLVTPSGGSSAAPNAFSVAVGNYFPTPNTSNSTVTPTLDQLRAHPIVVTATTTFDRIATHCTTLSGSALARLGIYADNGRGQPGALVLDAGTVALSSTGVRTITISQVLNPGIYHVASVHQAANTVVQNYTQNPFKYILSTNSPDNYSFSVAESYFQNSVSGALPGTFTVGGTGGAGSSVAVYLRGA